MEIAFRIIAVILAGIAAYFLWQKNGDGAFISAVIGAVCFFISFRFQVRARLKQREIEREEQWRREDEEAALLEAANEPDEIAANDLLDEKRTAGDERKTAL